VGTPAPRILFNSGGPTTPKLKVVWYHSSMGRSGMAALLLVAGGFTQDLSAPRYTLQQVMELLCRQQCQSETKIRGAWDDGTYAASESKCFCGDYEPLVKRKLKPWRKGGKTGFGYAPVDNG
jgi:hypothetical protein